MAKKTKKKVAKKATHQKSEIVKCRLSASVKKDFEKACKKEKVPMSMKLRRFVHIYLFEKHKGGTVFKKK